MSALGARRPATLICRWLVGHTCEAKRRQRLAVYERVGSDTGTDVGRIDAGEGHRTGKAR
jgi:hypothetical protein